MDRYKVGIVGCGWVGTNRHLPSYRMDDRAVVDAVYDHKPQKARKIARENDVPQSFGSLDELFDRDLDLVSICTPPWTHADLTERALQSGAHVLTEKPMAMTTEAAELMVETASDTGNTLGVVHNFLYADSMRETKQKVASGELGEVKAVYGFQTSSPRRHLPAWYPDLPGGLFYDESPHLLYLMEEFLGELHLDTVSARYDPDERQSLRMINASLKNDGGKMGALTMLFDAPLSEWYLTVVGSEQLVVVDIFRDIAIALDKEDGHDPSDVLGVSLSAMAQETTGIIISGVKSVRGTLHFGMDEIVSRYLDSLDGSDEPAVTGQEGVSIVRLMHEILKGVDRTIEGGLDWSSSLERSG